MQGLFTVSCLKRIFFVFVSFHVANIVVEILCDCQVSYLAFACQVIVSWEAAGGDLKQYCFFCKCGSQTYHAHWTRF